MAAKSKATKKKTAKKKASKTTSNKSSKKAVKKATTKTATKKSSKKKAGKSTKVVMPTHDEISAAAFKLWEKKGCPEGQDSAIWHEAERELMRAGKS